MSVEEYMPWAREFVARHTEAGINNSIQQLQNSAVSIDNIFNWGDSPDGVGYGMQVHTKLTAKRTALRNALREKEEADVFGEG